MINCVYVARQFAKSSNIGIKPVFVQSERSPSLEGDVSIPRYEAQGFHISRGILFKIVFIFQRYSRLN